MKMGSIEESKGEIVKQEPVTKGSAEEKRGAIKHKLTCPDLFPALFLVISIFYMETVFGIFTGEGITGEFIILSFLFSVSVGLILYTLSSLTPSPKINRIIRFVFLIIFAILFLVSYFVYRKFRVFYDIKTMTGGAGDALTDFFGDVVLMIFSPMGIAIILLILLPVIVYIFFGRHEDNGRQIELGNILIYLGFSVLAYLVAFDVIYLSDSLFRNYYSEYNYQTAVEDFGLLHSDCLDIYRNIRGVGEFAELGEFEVIGGADAPTNIILSGNDNASLGTLSENLPQYGYVPGETGKAEGSLGGSDAAKQEGDDDSTDLESLMEPKYIETVPRDQMASVYGRNILDIDFDALAANATSEQAKLDAYVQTLTGSSKNAFTGLFKGKNLIMITAEAFCTEVIDETLTPTLYRLATKGINFTNYYQPSIAGTTGGEYANLMGMLPSQGGASMKLTADQHNYQTMGNQLGRLGYYGMAYHNNDYTFYDRHLTHINLGYSGGYMGMGTGMEEYVSSEWPESDLEMMQGTLPTYIDKEPFNIYYMTVSGHSLYTRSRNAMAVKNWDEVEDLPYSDEVKCYLACQMELENALTWLVDTLEKEGKADDTVICISPDHFPYGLDSDYASFNMPHINELYGYQVSNYLERDHNRLILWCGELEDYDPVIVSEPTFSPDIVPTLCNLFGVEFDSRLLPGRDVFSDAIPVIYDGAYDFRTNLGTFISKKNEFTPFDTNAELPENYVSYIRGLVQNKITYSKGVLNCDYFYHVFGEY